MKGLLHIGRVFGIPVYFHWTFIVLFCWIFFYVLGDNFSAPGILAGLQFLFVIWVILILHEAAHVVVAKYFGWRTCAITFLPVGAISRTENQEAGSGHQIFFALAGPVINLMAGSGVWLFLSFVPHFTIQFILSQGFWFQFAVVNIFIGILNLIPALPMDGGRIVCTLSATPAKGKKVIRLCLLLGQLLAIGLMLYGISASSLMFVTGLFIFSGVRLEAGIEEANEILNNIIKVKGIARSKTWKPIHH